MVIYGHDTLTDHDFTSQLQPTVGGLGSGLAFDSPETAFDIQLGRFVPGGLDETLDLLVARGSTAPFAEVWPNQAGVLRDWDQVSANVSPDFGNAVRVYGDIDGDGLDEICYLDDQPDHTALQCSGFAAGQLAARAPIAIGAFHRPQTAQIVDVDVDGKPDLVAAFADGGVIVVHDLAGAAIVEVVFSGSATGVLATNLDADPELEIVAIVEALHVFDLTSGGAAVEIGGITGTFTGAIASADLDGDGVGELIVAEDSDTVLVLWPDTNTGPGNHP